MVKDRYGSVDNFKRTLMEDPIGTLADASMVLTAGGTAAATLPGKAGQVGRMVQKVGMGTEPINIAKTGAKAAGRGIAKMIPKSTPVSMYESSAKFSTTIPEARRIAMAETALKHGIIPTTGGLAKTERLLGELGTKIDDLIQTATAQGKTIPKGAIYRHLKATRRQLGGTRLEAGRHLRQVDRVAKELDLQLRGLKKSSLTPAELQTFKKSAYDAIDYDAAKMQSRLGTDEARRAMARAAKESIEDVAPGISDLNRKYGELRQLTKYKRQNPLARSAARIENRDLIGIGAPIKIGVGGTVGGPQGAAAGVIASLLENPKWKARAAVMLHDLQKKGMTGLLDYDLGPTLMQYGLLEAGRFTDESPPRSVKR